MNAHPCIAILGAGHAGGRVAQHLREAGHQGKVYLIGEETHAPYERPALSKELLLGTVVPASLTLAPASFWEAPNLALHDIERIQDVAVHVDVDNRVVHLQSGRELTVDTLVVATGGVPRRSGIPGADLPGVHVLRTLEDSLALRTSLADCTSLVVIGAGVIGMEVAASARTLGKAVTVLEAGPSVMARCLPASVAQWLADEHTARGVNIATHVAVDRISAVPDDGNGGCLRVEATRNAGTGEHFYVDAEVVLIAIGVDCSPSFLKDAGLGSAQGLSVNAFCRVDTHPWIYAAGDVAYTLDATSGVHTRQETWRNAEHQAMAVAAFIMGGTEPYQETPWMWTDQFGFNIQVVGSAAPDDQPIIRGEIGKQPTTVAMVRASRVSAGILINQGRERRHMESLVRDGSPIDVTKLADPAVALRDCA